MKKIVLALTATAALTFAADTTVSATMSLMNEGMAKVQKGLMYNDTESINEGIKTLENSNAIFKNVDVSTFIPNNHKIGTTKKIGQNLSSELKSLKTALNKRNFTDISNAYSKVLNNCMACHQVVRGW
jgi:cytochrome c556